MYIFFYKLWQSAVDLMVRDCRYKTHNYDLIKLIAIKKRVCLVLKNVVKVEIISKL